MLGAPALFDDVENGLDGIITDGQRLVDDGIAVFVGNFTIDKIRNHQLIKKDGPLYAGRPDHIGSVILIKLEIHQFRTHAIRHGRPVTDKGRRVVTESPERCITAGGHHRYFGVNDDGITRKHIDSDQPHNTVGVFEQIKDKEIFEYLNVVMFRHFLGQYG